MTIVGILNLDVDSGYLGRSLMFVEDLQVQARLRRVAKIELAVWVPDARLRNAGPILDVLASLDALDALHICTDTSHIRRLVPQSPSCSTAFPSFDEAMTESFQYDTTLRIKDGFDRLGSIPFLTMKPNVRAWALEFLMRHRNGGCAVAVHLKQVAGTAGESNADINAWRQFFAMSAESQPVRFLIIGDDPCPEEIACLPNISLMRDHGGYLVRDLAIIECADAFMGMASGPFNMALFGRKPYSVFKDPGHHAAEMDKEIGSANRYGFAGHGQIIRRVSPRPADLMGALGDMLASVGSELDGR